jgi:hypothetical protein
MMRRNLRACALIPPLFMSVAVWSQAQNALSTDALIQRLVLGSAIRGLSDAPDLSTTLAELKKREALPPMMSAYKARGSRDAAALVWVMAQMQDPKSKSLLQEIGKQKPSEASYWANQGLAKSGDRSAMARLLKERGKWPVPSIAWAETLHLLGEQGYYPASTYLIQMIDAPNLNAAQGAVDALRRLYPEVDVEGLKWPQGHRLAFQAAMKKRQSKKPGAFR